jgi:hypothetical protein
MLVLVSPAGLIRALDGFQIREVGAFMGRSAQVSLSLFLLLIVLCCAGCSFINSFHVINASDKVIEVRYKEKLPAPGSKMPDIPPSILPVSGAALEPLPSSRYKIDADNWAVVLTLNPGETLLLTQCQPPGGGSTGDCGEEAFDVEELDVVGGNGEISLKGVQVHKSFINQSNNRYTLTYR